MYSDALCILHAFEVFIIMQIIAGVSQYHMNYLNFLQFPIDKIVPMKFQCFHFPGKLSNFFQILKINKIRVQ